MNPNLTINHVEERIRLLLSHLYQVATYKNFICVVATFINADELLVKFNLGNLLPRYMNPSLSWAHSVYNSLKAFPCDRRLIIKFDKPKSNWTAESPHSLGYYSHPQPWTLLESMDGLNVDVSAVIPSIETTEIINKSAVMSINWNFTVEESD